MMLPKPSAEERTMTPQIKSHPIISKLIDGLWQLAQAQAGNPRDPRPL
jgi:hypothetical protein